MSSKLNTTANLCSLPDAVQFEFREEQEMNSQITITNLVDRVVTFKIKTNRTNLFLVKPMEGQIYNKSTATINFKRKELTLENFNLFVANPGQNREKFLIEFSSEVEDGVGIPQKVGQVAYLAVTFNKSSTKLASSEHIKEPQSSPSKKQSSKSQKQVKELDITQKITEKKAELQKLIVAKQTLLASRASSSAQSKSFTMQDLIYTVIFSFLLGFILI